MIKVLKKFLILAVFLWLTSAGQALASSGDYVVLLHGIGRTKITMAPLQTFLSWIENGKFNHDAKEGPEGRYNP